VYEQDNLSAETHSQKQTLYNFSKCKTVLVNDLQGMLFLAYFLKFHSQTGKRESDKQ